MRKFRQTKLLWLVLAVVVIGACTKSEEEPTAPKIKTAQDFSAEYVHQWTNLFLEVDKNATGYRGPVEARTTAYINLAAYEAVAPGMASYQSIAKNIPEIKLPTITEAIDKYHWGLSSHAAYYRMMKNLFPAILDTDVRKVDSLNVVFLNKLRTECDSATFARSRKFGEDVAKAIYDWSLTDGAASAFRNNKPADYVPPKGESMWIYTPPDYKRALLPYWGRTRAISLKIEDVPFKDPAMFSKDPSSAFYKEGKEVYDVSKALTYDQRWIAEFWSDDNINQTFMPAARWLGIAEQMLKQKKASLELTLLVNAKVGVALFDGSVVAWGEKYKYNLMRPVTYIQQTMKDDWLTALNAPLEGTQGITPAFPAYPSGHSMFGAAVAEALVEELGDMQFTDRIHESRSDFIGKPRAFKNLWEAAVENALSRIYLGVHFRMDCDEGLRIGKEVGKKVNALKWKKTAL